MDASPHVIFTTSEAPVGYRQRLRNTAAQQAFIATEVIRLVHVAAEFAAPSVEVSRSSRQWQRSNSSTGAGHAIAKAERGYRRWTDSAHLLVIFHELDRPTVTPLYRDPRGLPTDVVQLFQSQSRELIPKDYAALTVAELYTILTRISRSSPPTSGLPVEYALTADNMLKTVLIYFAGTGGCALRHYGPYGLRQAYIV